MFSSEIDKMSAQLTAKLSLFMPHSKTAYQNEQHLLKKFSNSMFRLESGKMTALWPNGILTFPFYVIISATGREWIGMPI